MLEVFIQTVTSFETWKIVCTVMVISYLISRLVIWVTMGI